MALAERIAADYDARLRSFGERAPGRFVTEVAGLTVVGFGVDEPWGLQVSTIGTAVDAVAVEGVRPRASRTRLMFMSAAAFACAVRSWA